MQEVFMAEAKTDVWQRLMDQAYARYREHNDWSYPRFLRECGPRERGAALLGNLNYQVENGGFSQWVDNGYALHGKEVVEVLAELEGDPL